MREIEVPMPKLSMTMEEGELIAWVKHEGDQVRAGDVICEVNSDKVEMEVESPADGTLVRLTAAEGEVVPVGAPIATLATEADDLLGGLLDEPAEAETTAATEKAGPETEATAAEAAQAAGGGRVPVVPAARRRAGELGVDLAAVSGSGPDGLVRVADVEAAAAAPPTAARAPHPPEGRPPTGRVAPGGAGGEPLSTAPPPAPSAGGDVEEVPLSAMRRTVARRLVESMQSTPHFYLTRAVDAEALLGFRAELNQQLDDGKVSVNDLLVKACAGLLGASPELNVSFAGDRLLVHRRVHVGIAVAIDGGLVVPVIRDADHKALTQLAREATGLVGRARAGKLTSDDVGGGTFTVSNLGMLGVEQFTAVINPPEAAILAVGAAVAEPVATEDGRVVVRRRLRLTLSIDHRAVDGATGARFLGRLKDLLEHPLRILA
jgi:pyruvate dehydrogenase E2 component (dihydrolipoamide acetyltransferase)